MSEQQQQQQQQSENEEGYVDWGKRFFNESWEAVKKKVHWMDTEEGAEMQHEEATSDDEDEEDGASKPAPPSLLKKGDEKHAPPGETTKRVSIARSIGRGLRNSIRGKRASQVSTPGPGMNAISEDEEAKLSEVEEEEEHDDEGEDDQAKDTEEDDDADSEEAKDTEEEEDEEQEAEDEEAEAEAEVEDAEAEAADEEEDEDEDEEAAAEEAEGGDVLGELGAAAASAAAVRAASQRSSSRRVSALRSSAKRMSISRSSMRSGGSKATNASAGSRESAKRNSLKQITKRISWRSKANKAEPAGGAFRRFSRSNRSSGVPEAKQARLEDSNIAGIGSAEDRAARLAAAESDKNLAGAGKNFGLEIWRVENKRTKNDTPDFGVRRWPKEEYGNFYSGDSYVILNTYGKKDKLTGKPTDAKDYDVHFWLGSESSQDEIGTAAIKTVELSALLDDKPVHHRERQGHESKLFLSYFKELVYLKGGHDSGFRKVKPKNYEPRLLMIRHTSRVTKAYSIPVDARCMNHGDAFVLDTGLVVYRWVGEDANVFEMNRSGLLQANICSSRYGKARKEDANDQFWKVLGGSIDDVRPASDPYEIDTHDDERLKADDIKLWRISDASGKLEFEMEAEGKVPYRLLDPDDVFLIHANIGLWIWLGDRATQYERSSGMRVADEYIRQLKLPNTMTVTSITQQQADTNTLFRALFAGR